jgi:hypothetical protein
MKKILTLGLLAALGGVSLRAATVTYSSLITPGQASITQSGIVATGYYYESVSPYAWLSGTVTMNANFGIGVRSGASTTNPVQGSLREYVMFDFGTGTTTVSSISLYLSELSGSPTTYFTYAWVSGPPTGSGLSSNPMPPLTAFTTAPLSGTGLTASISTFGPIPNAGRYLLIGASDHHPTNPDLSSFAVRSITYTTVPDGASTVALMGAAITTLGLAARRRKE